MKITRRDFSKLAAYAAVAPTVAKSEAGHTGAATNPVQAPIRLEPMDYTGVRLLDGMLKDQYTATRNFFFNLSDDDLLIGYRRRNGMPAPGHDLPGWYGKDIYSTFGQWLSGMARMYKATGDTAILDKAHRLMTGWGNAIGSDGYFYYSRHPGTPHYIYEKMVCGLVDLYHFGGQKEAEPLLERITDWASKNLDRSRKNPSAKDPGAGGQEWYTLSENLYRAYRYTGNPKYKEFGDLWRYPHYWDMFADGAEPTPFGYHAYSHVNTLSSAAMTYEVTGDERYLTIIKNAYDWFERTQFFATGGFGPNEQLQRPDGSLGKSLETTVRTFETQCGSWACFKLSKYLLQFTGDARYGDWMEKMVYNGVGASLPLRSDPLSAVFGNTYYYSDYGVGGARKFYFPECFPCCSGTISQAVPDYYDNIYFKNPKGLYVNLYIPSEVTWNQEGQEISIRQETQYPESETTTLTIASGSDKPFSIYFRVPTWCNGATAAVNGTNETASYRPGTWASIQRVWKTGDTVTIRIPSELKLSAVDRQHPKRVAVMKGAVVLVRLHSPSLPVRGSDPSTWMKSSGKPLQYRMQPQQPGEFVPYYTIQDMTTAYGMYFDLDEV